MRTGAATWVVPAPVTTTSEGRFSILRRGVHRDGQLSGASRMTLRGEGLRYGHGSSQTSRLQESVVSYHPTKPVLPRVTPRHPASQGAPTMKFGAMMFPT